MQTYLFYDIETTGLNKAFDQVLSFAAIRTDLQLNELERHDIKIKLNPDVILSPHALITHHIGIEEAQLGVSEIEGIQKIHALLNTPGTISTGYNTLGFDDEFLRFSFYRNLLPPYSHQFSNNCSRMDIYPMAVMYFLFKNEMIKWPKHEEKISLKLENINSANQFIEGRSHHAMTDVEITLELARCFLQDKKMWDYVVDYFKKPIDEKRSRLQQGLMIFGKLGSEQFFQSPVMPLGSHRHYTNQTMWLRLDTTTFSDLTQESIPEKTWVVKKKLSEPGFLLPLEKKYLTHLTDERLKLVETNRAWLQQNPAMLQQIINYHAEYKYPVFPETDIEARLYLDDFWSAEEKYYCSQFHSSTPKEKSNLIDCLKNSKLKNLAIRIMGRHFSEMLSEQQKNIYQDYLQQALNPSEEKELIDYRGEKRLTPKKALEDIILLKKNDRLTTTQLNLLERLEKHLIRA